MKEVSYVPYGLPHLARLAHIPENFHYIPRETFLVSQKCAPGELCKSPPVSRPLLQLPCSVAQGLASHWWRVVSLLLSGSTPFFKMPQLLLHSTGSIIKRCIIENTRKNRLRVFWLVVPGVWVVCKKEWMVWWILLLLVCSITLLHMQCEFRDASFSWLICINIRNFYPRRACAARV